MRMERYIFIRYHLAVMDRILAPLSPDLDCSRSPMLRAAVSAVILLLCTPAAPVVAQLRWHWPGAAATGAMPPASASQRAETTAAPGPALQLEWQAPVYLAWAVNPLDGPAEVRLSAPPSADYRAVPQLPLVQLLGARERRLLARVYPVSQRRTLTGSACGWRWCPATRRRNCRKRATSCRSAMCRSRWTKAMAVSTATATIPTGMPSTSPCPPVPRCWPPATAWSWRSSKAPTKPARMGRTPAAATWCACCMPMAAWRSTPIWLRRACWCTPASACVAASGSAAPAAPASAPRRTCISRCNAMSACG